MVQNAPRDGFAAPGAPAYDPVGHHARQRPAGDRLPPQVPDHVDHRADEAEQDEQRERRPAVHVISISLRERVPHWADRRGATLPGPWVRIEGVVMRRIAVGFVVGVVVLGGGAVVASTPPDDSDSVREGAFT